MTGALDGVTVVDFTQFMAGPLATQLLSDLGAEVVKVERPEGGDMARQGSASPFTVHGERVAFMAVNRNKRSVVLDLKDEQDLARARDLCRRADVVVENFRPGVMDRLGLGYDEVAATNPRLVYCSITGYGNEGPWAAAPGQDLLVQAVTGIAAMNGRRGDPPIPVAPPVVDAATGHVAALAIVSGLYERERSGQGQRVSTSLAATAMALQSQEATLYLNSAIAPERSEAGVANPYFVAPYGIYATADGHLALAHTSLPKFGELLDRPDLGAFTDPAAIYRDRDRIVGIIAEIMAERTTAAWLELLAPAGFWVAPAQTAKEFLDDPPPGIVWEMPLGGGEVFKAIAAPISLSRTPTRASSPPPALGADTDAVLGRSTGLPDSPTPSTPEVNDAR